MVGCCFQRTTKPNWYKNKISLKGFLKRNKHIDMQMVGALENSTLQEVLFL